MTLHAPTHPAGYAGHHYLRYLLLVVGAVALGLVLWGAVIIIQPTTEVFTGATASEQELYNDYRAGERAAYPVSEADQQQLYNDYRAGERAGW